MQTAAALRSLHMRRTQVRENRRPPEVARIAKRYKKAAEKPLMVVCDPQGTEERTLRGYLHTIEPRLIELAAAYKDLDISVTNVDKSRQTAINKLQGKNGAGDSSMDAHFDIVEKVTATVGAGVDATIDLSLLRVSESSDESTSKIAARSMPRNMEMRFHSAFKKIRREINLKEYKYEHLGIENDLDAFSKVLRHPEMLISCKFSTSHPRRITSTEQPGFIMREVSRLKNQEISFFEHLPRAFKMNNAGLGEVDTPFTTSLVKQGIERLDKGVFVEIKLRAKEEDAKAVLKFIKDGKGWVGTKKGHAEARSGLFGMRGFNTFSGEALTNSVLTPIAHAMKDFERTAGHVVPVNGGYLNYAVDMSDNEFTAELIKNAIRNRIKCPENRGPTYAYLDFEPHVSLLDARGRAIEDTRAQFILKSLGRDYSEPQILDMTDFMLNFIENIDPRVQEKIFLRLAQEGHGLSAVDRRNIDAIVAVCSRRRTIRDTEDLLWVLRKDDELPQEIQANKTGIENWLFEFAAEKAGDIVRMLTEEIHKIAKRG